MKKRDFYILGLLACLIIYASFNRKPATEEENATPAVQIKQTSKTDTSRTQNDSISINAGKVVKAGF